MDFVPYYELTGRPHVIADGSSRKSTVLTLSHWPQSGTPGPLKADLSAQIAFRYLDTPDLHVEVDAVSNDHLDIDGFVAVLTLARPDFARAHRELLVEVGRTGDFAVSTDTAARRIAFTIAALVEPETSTLDPAIFELDRPLRVAALYRALIEEMPRIVADVDRYAPLWTREEELLAASEEAFARGLVEVDEFPHLDLAVVRLDQSLRTGGEHRFAIQNYAPIHPIAIHRRTGMFRMLYQQGDHYGLCYRFESWVQYMSRRPAARVDLTTLAEALTADEGDGARWTYAWPQSKNPPVAWLTTEGNAPSTIAADAFVARIRDCFTAADADPTRGIDPYDADAPPPPSYGATADLVARGQSGHT